VIKTVVVPTLDDSEVLLVTREHVLSGSYFDAKRTDTLKKSNPRKWRKIKTIQNDGEHSMTVTGALSPFGKIKYTFLVLRLCLIVNLTKNSSWGWLII
jgi:hypothetical protein